MICPDILCNVMIGSDEPYYRIRYVAIYLGLMRYTRFYFEIVTSPDNRIDDIYF